MKERASKEIINTRPKSMMMKMKMVMIMTSVKVECLEKERRKKIVISVQTCIVLM